MRNGKQKRPEKWICSTQNHGGGYFKWFFYTYLLSSICIALYSCIKQIPTELTWNAHLFSTLETHPRNPQPAKKHAVSTKGLQQFPFRGHRPLHFQPSELLLVRSAGNDAAIILGRVDEGGTPQQLGNLYGETYHLKKGDPWCWGSLKIPLDVCLQCFF